MTRDPSAKGTIHMRTALALLSLSTLLMASESFYGTWKLNVAKSDIKCGDIASQAMTITETGPNTYRNVIDSVSKSGEKRHQGGGDRFLDGKEHSIAGQAGASEIIERVDASTHKITQKLDGKITTEITATVSRDGK